MSLADIQAYPRIQKMCKTGSREICNPAPTDTDEDWLVLIDPQDEEHFINWFELGIRDTGRAEPLENTWDIGGSHVEGRESEFKSLRKGEFNIIMTTDPLFYKYFEAATSVAKKLNLLNKDDRIMLFNAVMNGTKHEELQQVQVEIPF